MQSLNRWSTSRRSSLLATAAILGLAACIFAWGLGYKLSLYGPQQPSVHQIPAAKLLSEQERPAPSNRPGSVRMGTSVQEICAVATCIFLGLALASFPHGQYFLQSFSRIAPGARCLLWAGFESHFVRPPPSLA